MYDFATVGEEYVEVQRICNVGADEGVYLDGVFEGFEEGPDG